MKGEWCHFNDWLDESMCDTIIEEALKLPSQQAVLGANGTEADVNLDYRRSIVRFINKTDPNFQFLFDILWKTALRANDDFFGFHISKLDYLQFAEYDASYQGEYKDHHDVFWINGDPTYHRKLSCVIQLSDPSTYTGGDLQFVDTSSSPDPQVIRNRGCMIYFPSFFRHRATTVTSGKRYSIAAWFDGPKWR